jgi:hypothetical protein
MDMEAAAMEWLRYEHQCPLVVIERGVCCYNHRPDVFAVSKKRFGIEVEIKRTLSDFKADFDKRVTAYRVRGIATIQKFYYLVPRELVDHGGEKATLWIPMPYFRP